MMKLKALFLSVLGLLCLNFSQGQTFETVGSAQLESLESGSLRWIDLNNDLLYDLFVYGKQKDGPYTKFEIYLNQGDGSFEAQDIVMPDLIIHQLEFKDVDRDNIYDVVFAGIVNDVDSVLSVLTHDGSFNFQTMGTPLLDKRVESFLMSDLNYDTIEDLVVGIRSEQDSLEFQVLGGSVMGFEEVDLKFPAFSEAMITALDINNDGRKDLLLSGKTLSDTSTVALTNAGDLFFVPLIQRHEMDFIQIENLTQGAFDGDRFADFFASGLDKNGLSQNLLYSNDGNEVAVNQTLLVDYKINESLMVDFDSDGSTDLWLSAERNDSTYWFWYKDLANFSDTTGIFRDSLLNTAFADWNLDGHIDYAELKVAESGLEIEFFSNELEGNNFGPSKPKPQVAVQTGPGQMKVSWQSAFDSLTMREAISYDALLMDIDTTALFEANMGTQLFLPRSPNHGNQLYSDQLVIDNLAPGEYFYYVWAIDNAFNFLPTSGVGFGNGNGDDEFELGKAVICAEEEIVEEVALCQGSFRTFGKEGVIRNWYSDALGAIGTMDLLSYTATGEDVLYGSVVEFSNCEEGQLVFNISVSPADPDRIDIRPFIALCEPEELTYSISRSWTNVMWTSEVLGDLGTDHSISFTPEESDRIMVQAENPQGCTYQAFSLIELIDFQPEVADTVYTIEVGQSVQLSASGGDFYEWIPSETLDDASIAEPLASPRVSTDYNVTISNAQGCSEVFTITVNVEQIGAVANLFSPNGDNRNDLFYLQLSAIPAEIDFRIYTRAGNLVYQETQGERAISEGWDGTHKGEELPPGVYYWRVRGTFADGKPIKLNADNSGKVHLIR